MIRVSRNFIISVKLNSKPAYKIALSVGVDPNTLSKLMNGIVKVKSDNKNIIAVGDILGLKPKECFEEY